MIGAMEFSRQVGALPIRRGPDGSLLVLLVTTLQTQRWIIPKGWPWPGQQDCASAAAEAREEAGVVGEAHASSIGSYTYDYDFRWGGMPGALPRYAGPKDLAVTTDGHKAWDALNVCWFLRNHVGRDIPFLYCVSGTGKDSGHTSEFGWQDDPRAWAALRDARQPFCAFWSCGAGGELSRLLRAMRWDKSIPAFSNGSLDDNPGCGDPAHGDYYGQINGYVFWRH